MTGGNERPGYYWSMLMRLGSQLESGKRLDLQLPHEREACVWAIGEAADILGRLADATAPLHWETPPNIEDLQNDARRLLGRAA